MIPKKIHYCWFGGNELDDISKKCIESWRKFCPEYEIVEWNESNFPYDKNSFTKDAYECKKWAFVSDYARLYIIYNNGGIYLDTDVELIKSLDDLLEEKCFLGVEKGSGCVATGLGFGAEKNNSIIKELLDEYENVKFDADNTYNFLCPELNTNPLYKYDFEIGSERVLKLDNCTIYPSEYFCPVNYKSLECDITDNTYSIHHYAASWQTEKKRELTQIKKAISQKYSGDKRKIQRKYTSLMWKTELKYRFKESGIIGALRLIVHISYYYLKEFFLRFSKIFINKILNKQVIAFENVNSVDGNSGAVFDYIKNKCNRKKYLFVWILKDKSFVENKGKSEYYFEHKEKSFLKEVLLYSADFIFFDNIPIWKRRDEQICVYLSHGMPITKNVKGIINIPEMVDFAISTSKATENVNRYMLSLKSTTKSVISALPRVDVFSKSWNELSKLCDNIYDKTVIWLPTFRTSKYESERSDSLTEQKYNLPLLSSEDDYYKLDFFLKQNNMLLIIKLHPVQNIESMTLKSTSNILILTNDELAMKGINLNKLMSQTDALISDYSSAPYDYMFLDRPIGYVVDDFDEYTLGFAYENILELMPGDKIKTIDDFVNFLNTVKNGEDRYKNERNTVFDFMQDCKDFNNCERVLKKVGFLED